MAPDITQQQDTSAPLTVDMSKVQPLQQASVSAAPPLTVDMSKVQPLSQDTSSLDPRAEFGQDVIKAVTGPGTAIGSPMSPEMSAETSGLSDLAHGNFSEGLGKIWHSEMPHVVPGSPLEKIIQTVNPDFRGAGGVQATHATSKPFVDAAQFIDKKEHPVLKAATEAAQSLTSPESVSIMIATGGLGMVESPQALAVANRILSAGFSAQTAAQAYKQLKGFKEAYDKGDATEALYQLTHAVLSGTISGLAAGHATTGEQLPVASDLDKQAAGAAANGVKTGASAVADKIGETVDAAKKATGIGDSIEELVRRTSKPSKGKAADYADSLKAALPQLREVFKNNPNVSTPMEMTDAIQQHIDTIEDGLRNKARDLQGPGGEAGSEALLPDATAAVRTQLEKYFKEHAGAYSEGTIENATNEAINRLQAGRAEENGGKPSAFKEPSLFEAENLRRQLNKETAPAFGSDTAIPNAVRDAKVVTAGVLRNLIDKKYDDLGIKDVKEWRKQEAPLIDVKDQLVKAYNKSQEMGEFSLVNSAAKSLGWGALGTLLGHVPGGLAAEGIGIAKDYVNDRLNNPNRLIQSAAKKSNADITSTGAVTPTKSALAPPANPVYAYRARNVGETGIPGSKTPSATMSLEDAQKYAEGREGIEGKPQEIVKVDLSKTPHTQVPGPRGNNFVHFNGTEVPESALEVVKPEAAPEPVEAKAAPNATAAVAGAAANAPAQAAPEKAEAQTAEKEPEEAPDVNEILKQAAFRHGIPLALLAAQANQESKLDPGAVSKKGAVGVMQLMPHVAKSLGVDDLTDPEQNIEGGTALMNQLHKRFGRWDRALAAYNWSPDKVQNAIKLYGSDWLKHTPKETQNYVKSITQSYIAAKPAKAGEQK